MACPQLLQVTPALSRALPSAARALLDEGPIPDVHNYLVLDTERGTMIVDATWPLESEALGLPVNPTFTLGEDMRVAADPITCVEVPESEDPQAFKKALLAEHFTPEEIDRRTAFFSLIAG